MSRTSHVNQARVHNGYHYPRSILTALRSRLSFPRFVNEFRDCIDDEFAKYYLIAGSLSKVTGEQFKRFCQRIGADCDQAPASVKRLVNPALIDTTFTTTEYAFDSHKLRDTMIGHLAAANVNVVMDAVVEKVQSSHGGLTVTVSIGDQQHILYADHVFNCTYSRINYLLNGSGLELIPLRHEITEMCLVEVPDEFKNGVDGDVQPVFLGHALSLSAASLL